MLLNYFLKGSYKSSLPAVRLVCPPCQPGLFCLSQVLLSGPAQRAALLPVPFERLLWPGGFYFWRAAATSTPNPILACSQGHLIPTSCDTRNGPAATGAVAARRESRWQGHQSVFVRMENPGLGPGQPRKGSPVLGLARWAALQALGEAESQAALSQLLLRAGTSLQQPSQVRAMKNCCGSLLLLGPLGCSEMRLAAAFNIDG